VGSGFLNNNVGNYFQLNIIATNFENNFVLNDFAENNIGNNFQYNKIGNSFFSNNIQNDFGFGGGEQRGNVIGNNFNNNVIGEYFYDNNIGDNFTNNTVGYYFQFNRIETPLDAIDFTEYLGNLNSVSYPEGITGTNGTYTGISAISTSGIGVDAIFSITVTGNVVVSVEITTSGKKYQVADTITISSASFNGPGNLVLTVDVLNATPMVYGNYNKTIQKDFDGTPRLVALANSNFYITQYITQAID
jgi:hypothetical protein